MKILLLFLLMINLEAGSVVKKISIVETNNKHTILGKNHVSIYAGNISQLKKLKRYIEDHGFPKLKSTSDLEFIKKSMKWVTSQWKHNGWNQPPSDYTALDILKKVHKADEQYRCVEYGIVLTEILQAHGFLARTISVQSHDVAYGGFGKGHVASEIWSNELSKWLFFDPQFGVYISNENGVPLSFHEIYRVYKNKGWSDLNINTLIKNVSGSKPKQYKTFIANYFGYMKVKIGEDDISLGLDANKPTLTFQGLPKPLGIFTKDTEIVYSDVNKVTMVFDYDYEKPNYREIFKDLGKVKESELPQKFKEMLPDVAAKPLFIINLKNNIPNFSHYEYRFDNTTKWTKLHKDKLSWKALNSKNIINIRGVNTLGRAGVTTYMRLDYK
ncbi:MAG: hypothetical protein QF441_15715 [Bacteriovoracaceae bacterium]|nr:hypothetical protein [Bacteriovoracaceae bacterium]